MESRIPGSYRISILTSSTNYPQFAVREHTMHGSRQEAWATFERMIDRQSGPDRMYPEDCAVQLIGRHLVDGWPYGRPYWRTVEHTWRSGSEMPEMPEWAWEAV